ncbi:DUF2621 domain-containing protein [Sporosarcina sp. PTS2304]|uniref:DUF2621 domain-containing protein n=1 Tax=Sporosarcina sp. PTS2304 TaxID=2283194 RepID=UPI000E0CF567|nr:DUF2621 domain-containing protein [Sporosarcina sp. PTS2304]AXI01287.1 DUF2621 domain-containing protein [Sporosarcina sp. PTS2304]
MWFILFWGVVLIGLFAIGGFFMFRKFLKVLPKEDGKSTLDWEEHYVNESLHLWNDEAKSMLNELVTPVPELFRDVAKQKIAAKIGEIALEDDARTIEFDHIIEGYILATPKRDHKFLRKKLKDMEVDVQPYEHFFTMKREVEVEDYR